MPVSVPQSGDVHPSVIGHDNLCVMRRHRHFGYHNVGKRTSTYNQRFQRSLRCASALFRNYRDLESNCCGSALPVSSLSLSSTFAPDAMAKPLPLLFRQCCVQGRLSLGRRSRCHALPLSMDRIPDQTGSTTIGDHHARQFALDDSVALKAPSALGLDEHASFLGTLNHVADHMRICAGDDLYCRCSAG